MKKTIFTICLTVFAVFTVITAPLSVIPAGAKEYLLGDVDNSGSVTVTDALMALQASVGSRTLTPRQAIAADVNRDGFVTVTDALIILQVSAGKRADLGTFDVVDDSDTTNAPPLTTAPPDTTTAPPETTAPTPESEYEAEVIRLVNEIRLQNELPELVENHQLSILARYKSEDMQNNGYFDHISPTYGSAFDMMNSFGISYKTAGENIARGYPTPQAVVNAWMNSPGHRTNILNPAFTQIGVGYAPNGHFWTQMFIG